MIKLQLQRESLPRVHQRRLLGDANGPSDKSGELVSLHFNEYNQRLYGVGGGGEENKSYKKDRIKSCSKRNEWKQ